MSEESFDDEPYCETCFAPLTLACQKCGFGWQPIETAPKEGGGILAWNGVEMYVVWWNGKWVSTSCVDGYTTMHNATHWMPLPEPP